MPKQLVCPKHCNPPSSAPQAKHFECYPGNEPASTSQVRYAHKKIADYSSVPAATGTRKKTASKHSARARLAFFLTNHRHFAATFVIKAQEANV